MIVNRSDEFGRIVNLVDERSELVPEVDDRRKRYTALRRSIHQSRKPAALVIHDSLGNGKLKVESLRDAHLGKPNWEGQS